MGITVDVAYKSLNKYTEILCGDKVNRAQDFKAPFAYIAEIAYRRGA